MKRFILCTITSAAIFIAADGFAQYAPQAGLPGSTAIAAADPAFVSWASECVVQRGLQNIVVPDSGYVSAGVDNNAIGMSDGSIVSLGDSGVATLTFSAPIINGPGYDFAVFENGFRDPADSAMAFLELAFVEVSSDGINFFRFQSASNTQDTDQIDPPDNYMDCSLLNNLAGKYISGYGTPFNLDELSGISGLDVNNIVAVRLVDVIGDIGNHGSFDGAGHKINDPYPTQFPTGGFDLDAVGVIHQGAAGIFNPNSGQVIVSPNPASDHIRLSVAGNDVTAVKIFNEVGQTVYQNNALIEALSIKEFSPGMYYILIRSKTKTWTGRFIKD